MIIENIFLIEMYYVFFSIKRKGIEKDYVQGCKDYSIAINN